MLEDDLEGGGSAAPPAPPAELRDPDRTPPPPADPPPAPPPKPPVVKSTDVGESSSWVWWAAMVCFVVGTGFLVAHIIKEAGRVGPTE